MGNRVMIIDDDSLIGASLRIILNADGYETMVCEGGKEGIELLERFRPNIVLLDIRLGDMDGLDVLRWIKRRSEETQVIMITCYATIESAVEAMREGAFDYLQKPFDNQRVKLLVKKALSHTPAEDLVIGDGGRSLEKSRMPRLIGTSPKIKSVFQTVRQVSNKGDTTVLIQGESGVGKEWVAGYIHFLSPRFEKPFVKLNCACVTETLAESEFFGYEKGSFTGGSLEGKAGMFEAAQEGTLLLDEVGDLSLQVQSKLLRVLEDGTYFRVGGTREKQCNVRIIASTNKNLREAVQNGLFREDLYYRLSVIEIAVPPLRERKEDILPLARYFLTKFCRKYSRPLPDFSSEAEKILQEHAWRGNVRELRNAMERLSVTENARAIHPLHLEFLTGRMESSECVSSTAPFMTGRSPDAISYQPPPDHPTYDQVIKELLAAALHQTHGNQVSAARLLGISRAKLRYQLSKYGLV